MPQEPLKDLQDWVSSLTSGELRSIKSLLKARGGGGEGQQAQLLEWLRATTEVDGIGKPPAFVKNIGTISDRLKDSILDGLYLLHNESGVDAVLDTACGAIRLLLQKKLLDAAGRKLRRAKKEAYRSCRYGHLLQLLALEREWLFLQAEDIGRFETFRMEELAVLESEMRFRELQYRNDILRFRFRKLSVPRSPELLAEMQSIADYDQIDEMSRKGGYIEHALSTIILGTRELIERRPIAALERFELMLRAWVDRPDWQADQAPLVFRICKYYQVACLHANIPSDEVAGRLALIPDFKELNPSMARDFQAMLHQQALTLALNIGQFDTVRMLMPLIEGWISGQGEGLKAGFLLPFLRNFATAEFLMGNYAAANRHVIRILNMPNQKVRLDIQEFSRLLQVVLQYELGDHGLAEYLGRATKRHFLKASREWEFELAVLRGLEGLTNASDSKAAIVVLERMSQQLESLAAEVPGSIPVAGLMEMRIWVASKLSGRPIQEVFLGIVAQNLAELG